MNLNVRRSHVLILQFAALIDTINKKEFLERIVRRSDFKAKEEMVKQDSKAQEKYEEEKETNHYRDEN